MKTLKQIAKLCRVAPGTLAVRLAKAEIDPSRYDRIDSVLVKVYDAAAVRRIVKYLKDEPIGKKPGPKLGSKRVSGKGKR